MHFVCFFALPAFFFSLASLQLSSPAKQTIKDFDQSNQINEDIFCRQSFSIFMVPPVVLFEFLSYESTVAVLQLFLRVSSVPVAHLRSRKNAYVLSFLPFFCFIVGGCNKNRLM